MDGRLSKSAAGLHRVCGRTSRRKHSRVKHWKKPKKIFKKPFNWILEANRTLAEEMFQGSEVIREPISVEASG